MTSASDDLAAVTRGVKRTIGSTFMAGQLEKVFEATRAGHDR